MPDNWYYTQDGKTKIGPLTFAALQQLVASGTLQPTNMVLHEGSDNRWVQAKSVPGLFPQATVQSPPVEPPTQKSTGQDVQAKANELWARFLAVPKNIRYAILGGGGAGLVLMVCLCCGIVGLIGGNKGGRSGGDNADGNNPDAAKVQGDGGGAIKVQSTVMIREYKENQAAANAKYKGKTVEVSGTIKRITDKYVELEGWGNAELLTVDCHFDEATLAQFSKGRQMTARGTCEGKTPFGINVRRCTLVWKQ